MSEAVDAGGRAGLGGQTGRMAVLIRLAIGLAQGLALYLLFRATEGEPSWSESHPAAFAMMVLPTLFLPPLMLASVGRLRPLTLAIWGAIAAATLALLAWHDVVRQSGASAQPTPQMFLFSAAALFIAHHLIVPADRERRLLAPYPAYFDTAWMAGVQLAASVAFTGVFWGLLGLGAALFNVIGLSFLGDLLVKPWVFLPLTGLTFATAVHLTDVREGLIRGVRTIALMLLSWLLLVLTLLVGGFLFALPFTGVESLWGTGSATALLLATAGGMIILINAAYQDGREDNLPPAVLRIAVRVASVLLVPLLGVALWGLALRIGQHGLTPDRIIAAACIVVGVVYAAGYAYAALRTLWLRSGDWMAPLERTNVVAAVLAVVTILALFTPVADPARLSVADQTARLERGAVSAAAFDYGFLAFDSGKAGRAALDQLTGSDDPEVARRASEAQAAENLAELTTPIEPQDVTPVISVWPRGARLPEGFIVEVGDTDPRSTCRASNDCLAALRDLNGDGQNEVLLARQYEITLFARTEEGWAAQGEWRTRRCDGEDRITPQDAIRRDLIRTVPSPWPDLMAGSQVAGRFEPANPECVVFPGMGGLFGG